MQQKLVQLGPGAHALAIQILGNRDDAADAVHDSLAKALANPDAWDARRGELKPWFLRVVRNRCLDLIRRRRAPGEPVDALIDGGPSPEAAASSAEQHAAVRRALAALTEDQREIIVLRDYLDLNYADIASVLDIAKGTVMSRLHRARLALKEEFENHV
ncbi:MAG: sigma-70 family RNA polymerase sigma factor [Pseudomonadota bacterium]